MCFNQLKYGEYEQSEQSVTLRANSGDCGGGSEVLILNEPYAMESAQANAGIMRGGCPTLNASHENPILIGGEAMKSVVRRLTPLE